MSRFHLHCTGFLRAAALVSGLSMLSSLGCAGDDTQAEADETVGDTVTSFQEFEAQVYREPETGIYIVDGDTPIETREGLERFYEEHVQDGALIVNRVNNADDKWSDSAKLNLTYCVSTTFGAKYQSVVQAMASATTTWREAADIRFVYLSSEDPSCTAANNNVVFNVSPTSGQPYLARAFFPSSARASRNILIDATSFGAIAPFTLTGVLRHELGHSLGLRHEHTRPEAGTCFEDSNWRALTPYDAASVMHYPSCNGTNAGDLVLTQKDRDGIALLYGHGVPAGNLDLWLRADAGITLNGATASVWKDQSGNAHDGTMATAARQPSVIGGALNGKPVVRFSGAQSMYLTTPIQPTQFTVFVVGKNNNPSETFGMILGPGSNFANNQLRWENGSQAYFVGIGNNMPSITSTVGNTRVYHALSARYDGSTMTVYRDGNLVSSHSFSTTGPWTLAQVGGWFSTYFLKGDIAEILAYDNVLSEANRSSVNLYLKTKYLLP